MPVDLELSPKQKRAAGERCCEPVVYPDGQRDHALRMAEVAKALGGNGTFTWPHSGTLIWPPPVRPAADCSRLMWLERKVADGDGITSGDVRADKKRSRPRGPV